MIIEAKDLKEGELPVNKIIHGDVLEVLKKFPSNSVDLIVTSPPYWGLRTYLPANSPDKDKEIGLEEHPQEYIDKIVRISVELMRILKPTGTYFLNLGDSYYTQSGAGAYDRINKEFNKVYEHRTKVRGKYRTNWLQPKQKLLIPHRIAIALQDLGFLVRDDIVWVKKLTKYPERKSEGSTMPSSVSDRFISATEYIFQINKSDEYYFDLTPALLELKESTFKRAKYPVSATYRVQSENNPYLEQKGMDKYFAKLREQGVELGKTWWVKIKSELEGARPTNAIMFKKENQHTVSGYHFAKFPLSLPDLFIKVASKPNSIVLDPFLGSGTTALVALKLGRKFVGIDLNREFCEMAYKRIKPYLEMKRLDEFG